MKITELLADERIFVLARVQPKTDRPGTDKIPTDPVTGCDIDAQNQANWITGSEAKCYAALWNAQKPAGVIAYGVGIVIAEGSGWFCVDLDKCREGDGWKPYVSNFVERFPGAYVEVSQSHEGLHVLGRAREFPQHGTRNADYHMECYSKARFIYVTGLGARGDPRADLTDAFKLFATQFFPKTSKGSEMVHDGPCPEWRGPADDAELVRRAEISVGPKGAFAGAPTFSDFWRGNRPKLLDYYRGDESALDMAFANLLAFWTGRDGARMQRLMMASGVKRDKYEREDYLPRTIERACADTRNVYAEGREVTPHSVIAPMPVGAEPPTMKRGDLVRLEGQKELFAGSVYVQDIHEMADPDGFMLSKAQFDAHERYGGREYMIGHDEATTDSAWDCFTQSKLYQFPQVRGTRFDPREPEGAIIIRDDGLKFVNIWRDPKVRSKPGDASRFVNHIGKLLPNGDDALILLCYLAACVQYRGVKAAWAPFIQGMEGNGKSLIGESVMRYCLGARYTHKARADKLDGQFNAAFYGKLLVLVDDVKARSSVWEVLKPMITEPSMEIEPKGVDKVTREVCFNFLFTANPKDGLKKSSTDRRICPLYCAQQESGDLERDGLTEQYFVELFHWLENEDGYAIVLDYLQHFEIDPRYNFAVGCLRAPRTTSTEEALRVGLGATRQRLQELIEAGDTQGLKGGWINWRILNGLLDLDSDGKRMTPGERREMLAAMGYIRHPNLKAGQTSAGQVDNPLPDGTRPVLYIKRDHPDVSLRGALAAQYYWAAQNGHAPPPPPPDT